MERLNFSKESGIEFEPVEIKLYESKGKVYFIDQFAKQNLDLLAPHEQEVIMTNIDVFPKEKNISPFLRVPWTRSEWLRKSEKIDIVNRGGERSAYHPLWKINFKGCRPVEKEREYRNMVWNFESSKLMSSSEAYGVLAARDIMSEILAVAFMHQHKIANIQMPTCIYEYFSGNKSLGYSLAIACESDFRIENLVDDIENISYSNDNRQIGFTGIDFNWYCQQKVDSMITSHFNGGFRNYTNCNYGNEIVVLENGKASGIYFTDFDKFFLIKIPQKPDYDFLKKFYLTCFIELAESSTPTYCAPKKDELDDSERLKAAEDFMLLFVESGTYVFVKNGESIKLFKKEQAETTELEYGKVAQIMLAKWSPLYGRYKEAFFSQAKILGWDLSLLEMIEKESIENNDYRKKLLFNTTNWRKEAIERVHLYHHRHN